jgi:hypothetical protein
MRSSASGSSPGRVLSALRGFMDNVGELAARMSEEQVLFCLLSRRKGSCSDGLRGFDTDPGESGMTPAICTTVFTVVYGDADIIS